MAVDPQGSRAACRWPFCSLGKALGPLITRDKRHLIPGSWPPTKQINKSCSFTGSPANSYQALHIRPGIRLGTSRHPVHHYCLLLPTLTIKSHAAIPTNDNVPRCGPAGTDGARPGSATGAQRAGPHSLEKRGRGKKRRWRGGRPATASRERGESAIEGVQIGASVWGDQLSPRRGRGRGKIRPLPTLATQASPASHCIC